MYDIGGVEEGPEEGHSGVETIMERLEQDWGTGLRELWEIEKDLGFDGVGYGWLLEEHVFSCTQGADSPLEVERVGEWYQHAVDGRVVENLWTV